MIEDRPKLVDEYLNEVDYTYLSNLVPSEFAIKLIHLIKLIEGGNPENKSPPVHFQFIDTLVTRGNTVNMCHRGFAKTTVKEYLMWYIIVFGELPEFGAVPYALYVSDSMDNGVKKMRRSMETRYYNSPFLQQYVPTMKMTDPIWDFTNADGVRCVITGHGAQTGVRGTRENNSRPVLALLDDLISDTDANSPTVISNVEDTIYNAIFAALHPTRRKIIWSGTPFNAGDPLYKAVESGAWNVNVFPVCEKFPCEPSEFRGSWEDRFTYDSVAEAYRMLKGSGKLDAFNQEYMLRIMSDEDKLIDENIDIQWYPRQALLDNRGSFNFYITTDLSTGGKKSNDFAVISVWAINNIGQWFWVDGVCEKQLMDKSIDDLFNYVQEYNPMSVGIEVSGQQGGFVTWLKSEMLSRGIFFYLASANNKGVEGIRPVADKHSRFMNTVPLFKQKKIYFPTECKESKPIKEAINELSLATRQAFKSKHDDFIDTISMLNELNAVKPSGLSGSQDNEGRTELYTTQSYSNRNSYVV